jgi:hypothetical protein
VVGFDLVLESLLQSTFDAASTPTQAADGDHPQPESMDPLACNGLRAVLEDVWETGLVLEPAFLEGVLEFSHP